MQAGTIVIFKNPTPSEVWPDGRPVKMQVREMRGDRCLVMDLETGLLIPGTSVQMVSDLTDEITDLY